MANENSGLLIAALVAIVAVVGLVILFKSSTTGASICPPGQMMRAVANYGDQGYFGCQPMLSDVKIVPQQGGSIQQDPYGTMFETREMKKQRKQETLLGTIRR